MGAVVLKTWGVILGLSCWRIIIVGDLVESQDRRELTLACNVVCARPYCNSYRVFWLHTVIY